MSRWLSLIARIRQASFLKGPVTGSSIAVLLGLAALCVLTLLEPIGWLSRIASPTYVEGWIADHAARVARGGLLYDTHAPFNPYNYPPLYAELLAMLGGSEALIGLGRKLALASTAAMTLAVFSLARALALPRLESACAALFTLAFLAGVFPGYVASNDPTLPGYAVSTAALAVFAARWRKPGGLLAAALLVALAGTLKHHLVAAPLAMTAFLALQDRDALLRWLTIAAGVLAALLLALWLAYGSDPFEIVLGPRGSSLDRLLHLLPKRLTPLAPALLIATVQIARDRGSEPMRLLGCYLVSGLATALVFSSGNGVHHNVFFDVVIALGLALGAALQRSSQAAERRPGGWRSVSVWALPVLALLPLLVEVPRLGARAAGRAERMQRAEREMQLDLAHLRLAISQHPADDAPILCETPAFCYWAGRSVSVDLFNSRQAFLAGSLDEALLLRRIEQREFAAIQLEGLRAGPWHERISPELLSAIGDHYRVLRESGNGYLFYPPPIVGLE